MHSVSDAAVRGLSGKEWPKKKETHLVIPLIPSLRDDRFERGELLIGHGQRAEDMLLEQRRARKRQQQRRRERLPAIMSLRERRVRLTRYRRRLAPHLVLLQRAKRRAVRGRRRRREAVLDVLELLHAAELIAHVEPELAELLLLHQRTMLALSFPCGRPHALAARELGGGELRRGRDEGLCEGRLRRGRREGLLGVRDGGDDGWWGVLLLLLLLLHTHQTVLQTGVAVAFSFSSLPLGGLFPLMSLAGRLILA